MRVRAGLLVLALPLFSAVSGSAADSTPTLPTAGPVELLAADGPLAAAVVSGDEHSRCTQILVWRPGSRPTVIKTQVGCGEGGPLEGVDELALGGRRVLWEETNGGNNLELIVNSATVDHPAGKVVSYVENGDGAAGDPAGDYTGYLAADGPLLVFASWTQCETATEGPSYADACVKGQPKLYGGALHRLVGGKNTVLRSGDDMLYPLWVDGGRILVGDAGPKLLLLRTSGATLRTFDVGTGVKGAVFQGSRLAVLKATALDVYDTETGAKTHSYRLSATPRQLVDLQGGIAVIVSGGAVRLIQLDTGKGTSFVPHGGGSISAQLEPTGLFTASAKELAFVPMASVLARFR